jgi:hypothetical protein
VKIGNATRVIVLLDTRAFSCSRWLCVMPGMLQIL